MLDTGCLSLSLSHAANLFGEEGIYVGLALSAVRYRRNESGCVRRWKWIRGEGEGGEEAEQEGIYDSGLPCASAMGDNGKGERKVEKEERIEKAREREREGKRRPCKARGDSIERAFAGGVTPSGELGLAS